MPSPDSPQMLVKALFISFFLLRLTTSTDYDTEDNFTFNGFTGAYSLSFDGATSITSDGVLELTSSSTPNVKGHAFYSKPLNFKSPTGKIHSFSTTFVFSILTPPEHPSAGYGIAFVISRTVDPFSAQASQYLGLFNSNNYGNASNHVVVVELGTAQSPEFQDIDYNHIGIDINSLTTQKSSTAGYFDDNTGLFKTLSLTSGRMLQLWLDFDNEGMQLKCYLITNTNA